MWSTSSKVERDDGEEADISETHDMGSITARQTIGTAQLDVAKNLVCN